MTIPDSTIPDSVVAQLSELLDHFHVAARQAESQAAALPAERRAYYRGLLKAYQDGERRLSEILDDAVVVALAAAPELEPA